MKFYRYEDYKYAAPLNEYDEPKSSSYVSIECMEFEVIKETKCGVWIYAYGNKKFVNTNARKQYASKTKEKAKECFIARKKRYISILSAKISSAEQAVHQIQFLS